MQNERVRTLIRTVVRDERVRRTCADFVIAIANAVFGNHGLLTARAAAAPIKFTGASATAGAEPESTPLP